MFRRPPLSPLTYTRFPYTTLFRSAIGADGRGLKQNILDFLKRMREEDLNCPLSFVDPQTDRSNPDAQAKSSNLRVVNKTDEGIFVTGVKSVGTGIAFEIGRAHV